jgi:hypothetical protein
MYHHYLLEASSMYMGGPTPDDEMGVSEERVN